MARLSIDPKGPFSLAASRRFLEGFAPAGYEGKESQDHVHLAFPVEGRWPTVGACVRQKAPGGRVTIDVVGEGDHHATRSQLARIFSLDVDGSGFAAVGRRDPVIGRLQQEYQGLRPVCFWSSYEAASWAVISHRIRIMQAATVKERIAVEHGTTVDVDGERVAAFPSPAKLAHLGPTRGLNAKKVEQLQGIGRAAGEGKLDSGALRSLPREEALDRLKRLPGIGPFSADLVLMRGAGDPDSFPRHERRLGRVMAEQYGVDPDDTDAMEGIAEKWRPYRTWATLLLRVWLEDQTGEIAGRQPLGRR